MKTIDNEILVESNRTVPVKNKFFRAHLFRNSFHGFWYDTYERSYGIKLSFGEKNGGMLNFYAEDARGKTTMFKYEVKSDTIRLDQISYDKVIVSTSDYKAKLIEPKGEELKLPSNIEFSLQLLSHNSIYVHFSDCMMYSPPVNKLQRGLVLAREYK
jgi:hypothetical protein